MNRHEDLWKSAKKKAERVGKGRNYSYVLDIYKKMRNKTVLKAYDSVVTGLKGGLVRKLETMRKAETPIDKFDDAVDKLRELRK